MCGRFTLAERLEQLKLRFQIDEISFDYKPSYNIAPTDEIVTVSSLKEKYSFNLFKWGIPVGETLIINARSDKMESNQYYTKGITDMRCLVPASGFYEWIKSGSKKVPYYIKSKTDTIISFAGFYQQLNGKNYATIITTNANEHVSKIHSRMPVILLKKDESTWLDSKTSFKEAIELLKPYPNHKIESYVVNSNVNNVGNNSADLIRPKTSLSSFF